MSETPSKPGFYVHSVFAALIRDSVVQKSIINITPNYVFLCVAVLAAISFYCNTILLVACCCPDNSVVGETSGEDAAPNLRFNHLYAFLFLLMKMIAFSEGRMYTNRKQHQTLASSDELVAVCR